MSHRNIKGVKISFIILFNGWYSTEPTGGGKTVIKLAEQYIKMNIPVVIIAPSNWKDYIMHSNIVQGAQVLDLIPTPQRLRAIFYPFIMIIRILELVLKCKTIMNKLASLGIKSAIIFVHHDIFNLIGATIFKKIAMKYNLQVWIIFPYYHIYPSIVEGGFGGLTAYLALRFSTRYIDLYYTESSVSKKLLEELYNVDSSRIFVAGVGVDYDYITNKCPNEKEETFDACFIGRIHPAKGVYDLVKAWKIVTKRVPKARLAIIGSGFRDYEERLRKFINELSLEKNIQLLGYLPEEEKIKVLCKSKCLIHPSYGECIPLVFLEAMGAGVPIITYMLPTYVDVKEYLVPVQLGDINMLAEKIYYFCIMYNIKHKLYNKLKEYAKRQKWYYIAQRLLKYVLSTYLNKT